MTESDPEPLHRRPSWLPRERAPLGTDVPVAFFLFLVEAWLFFRAALVWGMSGWAGQTAAQADEATRAGISRLEHLLIAAVVCGVIAALLRAPCSSASQLVIAAVLAFMVLLAQGGYDQAHQPAPAPSPSVWYDPCYSGSHGPSCQ